MDELVERALALAVMARGANMGFNIDAEEAERLDLSLDVIEAVLADPRLAGWDGFGVVVQAYGPRAGSVIDWLDALAEQLDRRIMVRLVKGAYWDAEIKRAQVLGLDGFPVFTRKAATDVSYIANARKLLEKRERIYPQFATHNAHTRRGRAASRARARRGQRARSSSSASTAWASALHQILQRRARHQDAHLRAGRRARRPARLPRAAAARERRQRLLRQQDRRPRRAGRATWSRDPFDGASAETPQRPHPAAGRALRAGRAQLARPRHHRPAGDRGARRGSASVRRQALGRCADRGGAGDEAEHFRDREPGDRRLRRRGRRAPAGRRSRPRSPRPTPRPRWAARPVAERAAIAPQGRRPLRGQRRRALCALRARGRQDAGRRRRRGARGRRLPALLRRRGRALGARGSRSASSPASRPGTSRSRSSPARSPPRSSPAMRCSPSPPSDAADRRARRRAAARGRRAARRRCSCCPATGATVGARAHLRPAHRRRRASPARSRPRKAIDRAMAEHLAPDAPLIAETGGLNAMIVDSTALPEQAVRDILASAFQSAGQRCSALRVLYLQEEARRARARDAARRDGRARSRRPLASSRPTSGR